MSQLYISPPISQPSNSLASRHADQVSADTPPPPPPISVDIGEILLIRPARDASTADIVLMRRPLAAAAVRSDY